MKRKLWTVLLLSIFIYYFLGDFRFFLNSPDKVKALSKIFSLKSLGDSLPSLICFTGFTLINYIILYYQYGKRKRWQLLLLIVIASIFIIGLRYVIDEVILLAITGSGNYRAGTTLSYYFVDNLFYAILYGSIGTTYFFFQHSIYSEKEKAALEAENKSTQLKFLKSQVNPHFLFNSLNNIYSLVYKKSDKALVAMDKMTKLLRYSLYEVDQKVSLENEIEQIQNFMGLQALRREKEIAVNLNIGVEDQSIKIPPLLLIPFVENAYKHGELHEEGHPINIQLEKKNDQLIFEVNNLIKIQEKDGTGGIGLSNIKKRLQLLYGGQHELKILNEKGSFNARLKIPLSQ